MPQQPPTLRQNRRAAGGTGGLTAVALGAILAGAARAVIDRLLDYLSSAG